MNITVFYATDREERSSTYQIAQMLIKELLEGGTCFEFQLPKDMPHICIGCYACIHGSYPYCHGAVTADPVICSYLCISRTRSDENVVKSLWIPLTCPPPGSFFYEEAGYYH